MIAWILLAIALFVLLPLGVLFMIGANYLTDKISDMMEEKDKKSPDKDDN